MIAVTIAIGDKWHDIAQRAAIRMFEMTGVEWTIITENFANAFHPSWLKAKIIDKFPNEDSFLVFDADIICLQPWHPKEIFESFNRPFIAVPDDRSHRVGQECRNIQVPFPDFYVNGGLLIFGKEHKDVWDMTWSKHPEYGYWLEQGALNKALLETGVEVCRLPRYFNFLAHGGSITPESAQKVGIINYHTCSTGSADVVSEAQKRFGL